MTKGIKLLLTICVACVLCGCDVRPPTSDDIQRKQQETILEEATKSIGMPAIKNFREKKILKDILQLRDQLDYVTYAYLDNINPVVVVGKTCNGGKLTYLGTGIGYPIPYSTQFTNPSKAELLPRFEHTYMCLPQADPNGLFSPSSSNATWYLMKDPNGNALKPIYCEPNMIVSPFKLPFDGVPVKPQGQSIGAEAPGNPG